MRSLWFAAAAPPDWMQIVPPCGLMLLRDLGEVDADVVVVGADIGEAQALVLLEQVGVPGQDRDAGLLGRLERLAHGGGVGGRDGDAVDLLGDQVVDDLDLLLAAAMLAGADIDALELAADSFSAFLQPSRAWSKNGLFMFFGTSAKVYFLRLRLAAPAPGQQRQRRRGADQQLLIVRSSLMVSRSAEPVSARASAADPLAAEPRGR